MSKHRFRIRFRLAINLDIEGNSAQLNAAPLVQGVTIQSNNPKTVGATQWITLNSSPYASENEARAKAQHLKDAILLSCANGVGADLGIDRATGFISDDIKQATKDNHGITLRDNVHGIDIFADGNVKHSEFSASASAHMDLTEFTNRLIGASHLPRLNTVTQTGAELINDSFFSMPDEARFLLRVSAIEALCEQRQRDESIQLVIDELLKKADSLGADASAVRSVKNVLTDARRQSVRQACFTKIQLLLGEPKKREFDRLYGLRSKYVHEGGGRGMLSNAANDALQLATSLLLAAVNENR